MKILTFDLEIAKELPEPDPDKPHEWDWKAHRPLGIACAAVYSPAIISPSTNKHLPARRGRDDIWQGKPQMTKEECASMAKDLMRFQWLVAECARGRIGYTLLSYGGNNDTAEIRGNRIIRIRQRSQV